MSASDVIYACGCFSFSADHGLSQGSGGFCDKHKAESINLTGDDYYRFWKKIASDNKGNPKNWGAAD